MNKNHLEYLPYTFSAASTVLTPSWALSTDSSSKGCRSRSDAESFLMEEDMAYEHDTLHRGVGEDEHPDRWKGLAAEQHNRLEA